MFKNKLGEDSPIPKFKHLKIRRRDGVESLTVLEEGEFKVPIDGCIRDPNTYQSISEVIDWLMTLRDLLRCTGGQQLVRRSSYKLWL